MKKMRHNLFLVCLLVLCTTICHAETITTTHVFSNMGTQIQYFEGNTVAETDLLTYTCSNGAKFDADPDKTYGKISIFMITTNATLTTTQIDNLKEIDIYHYPQQDLKIDVSVSTDEQNWEKIEVVNQQSAYVRATMPATGDYYLRIQRNGQNFYIHTIKYTTEQCACFPYIKSN